MWICLIRKKITQNFCGTFRKENLTFVTLFVSGQSNQMKPFGFRWKLFKRNFFFNLCNILELDTLIWTFKTCLNERKFYGWYLCFDKLHIAVTFSHCFCTLLIFEGRSISLWFFNCHLSTWRPTLLLLTTTDKLRFKFWARWVKKKSVLKPHLLSLTHFFEFDSRK